MPLTRQEHRARFEAKQREAGYVRGPRITAAAAERLRELAFTSRMTPSAVVSRLIELAGEDDMRTYTAMRTRGLSRAEAQHVVREGLDQP